MILLKDPALRKKMGGRGREIYLEQFTAEKFWCSMEEAFLSVVTCPRFEGHLKC